MSDLDKLLGLHTRLGNLKREYKGSDAELRALRVVEEEYLALYKSLTAKVDRGRSEA